MLLTGITVLTALVVFVFLGRGAQGVAVPVTDDARGKSVPAHDTIAASELGCRSAGL